MNGWISAIIYNRKGEKEFYQFDNEEELRYFLACNEGYKLEKATHYEE
jgi:hypothetical protein